ncbi:N-acetylglutamate synthase, CG3035 family [Mycolicibacterium arenosum]|uniref:GNAT family N-acetyltransferase n=1 Tax=Mycolicibacterium arenosum TaxID=2952157 RepID=A0ABT1LYL6_9MYCO|nr:GNAT family N-acetyltransferase [Mycolicibacterium sp. CAU 1645]MCP9271991.1 GNAT family N-acetyltransferase [Mycolicibacterium sp. CAU 1645]
MKLPPEGSRVSLRYRLPEPAARPYTDVVGHVELSGPTVRVRTRHGELVSVDARDVQAFRIIPEQPVRTSQIRNLEHAAARGWPGTEQHWIDGWLLRFGGGHTRRANSAIPLEAWASPATVPAIIDWYAARDAPPLIAAPDRLFRVLPGVATDGENLVMVSDVGPQSGETLPVITPRPDALWRAVDPRGVPDDVLTAVIEGEVAFATFPGVAVARGAVTEAPDGTRWLGLSAVHVNEDSRGRGHGRGICSALVHWGHQQGATRAYTQVLTENKPAIDLFEAMGFTTQHRVRYVDARNL